MLFFYNRVELGRPGWAVGSNCSLTSSHPHCNFSKGGQSQGPRLGRGTHRGPGLVWSGEGKCHQPKPIRASANCVAGSRSHLHNLMNTSPKSSTAPPTRPQQPRGPRVGGGVVPRSEWHCEHGARGLAKTGLSQTIPSRGHRPSPRHTPHGAVVAPSYLDLRHHNPRLGVLVQHAGNQVLQVLSYVRPGGGRRIRNGRRRTIESSEREVSQNSQVILTGLEIPGPDS